MKQFLSFVAALVLSSSSSVWGYNSAPSPSRVVPGRSNEASSNTERRAFLASSFGAAVGVVGMATPFFRPLPANAVAIPGMASVTLDEFDLILKDSAKSVIGVELSGPKSETALVKLADGTTFSVSDLVESSTDPRSPLKLVALCRLYGIPVKNVGLLAALNSATSKRKVYMNPRVAEAAEKEKAKKLRMEQDERDRLAELYRMEGEVEGFLEAK